MFPEIVREDVFRLETRRLWLRWPQSRDGEAHSQGASAAPTCSDALPEADSGDPHGGSLGLDAERIEAWRAQNADGQALRLVVNRHGADRRPIGTIGLVPVRERIENCGLRLEGTLDVRHRGQGLMTEAAQAVVDAAFMLTDTPLVSASARVRDPAFRRVLEKCGFSYCGHGLDALVAAAGLVASDRFRLDRKAWASLKAWRIPGVVRGRARADSCCQPTT